MNKQSEFTEVYNKIFDSIGEHDDTLMFFRNCIIEQSDNLTRKELVFLVSLLSWFINYCFENHMPINEIDAARTRLKKSLVEEWAIEALD